MGIHRHSLMALSCDAWLWTRGRLFLLSSRWPSSLSHHYTASGLARLQAGSSGASVRGKSMLRLQSTEAISSMCSTVCRGDCTVLRQWEAHHNANLALCRSMEAQWDFVFVEEAVWDIQPSIALLTFAIFVSQDH